MPVATTPRPYDHSWTDQYDSPEDIQKVSPEALGLNIEYLSKCNDIVDNATRKPIVDYKIGNTLEPDVIVELGVPFEYDIRSTMVHQYIRNINKTSVTSRHDFKGGYNQWLRTLNLERVLQYLLMFLFLQNGSFPFQQPQQYGLSILVKSLVVLCGY